MLRERVKNVLIKNTLSVFSIENLWTGYQFGPRFDTGTKPCASLVVSWHDINLHLICGAWWWCQCVIGPNGPHSSNSLWKKKKNTLKLFIYTLLIILMN